MYVPSLSQAVEIVAGAMMVEPAPPKGGTAAAAALAAAAPGAAAATKELSAAAACQTLIEQAALRWRHFEVGAAGDGRRPIRRGVGSDRLGSSECTTTTTNEERPSRARWQDRFFEGPTTQQHTNTPTHQQTNTTPQNQNQR